MSRIDFGDDWATVAGVPGVVPDSFYGPNAFHKANLWAHGYPALLEAVQRYSGWTGDPEPGERVVARRLPESYEAIRVALYDAMKACEPPAPPKKTREELLERIAEQAREMVNGGNVPLWDQFTQLEESVTALDEAED